MAILELPETQSDGAQMTWHVAVTYPGQFPFHEARCPCAKAACGLVIPSVDVECDVHHDRAPLRQAHPAHECADLHRRGLFRRRRH
jgi:hypothetical protein